MLRILTQTFIVVPNFVTKVTEYLCAEWFFLQTNFVFFKLVIFDAMSGVWGDDFYKKFQIIKTKFF